MFFTRKSSGLQQEGALSFGFLLPLKRPRSAPMGPQKRKYLGNMTGVYAFRLRLRKAYEHGERASSRFAESNGGDADDYNTGFLFRDDGGVDAQHRLARVFSLARGNWVEKPFGV